MMLRIKGMMLALALGVAATACGRSVRPFAVGSVQPAADALTLHVQDNNFDDLDVYVVTEGVATRMGTVSSGSRNTFVVAPSYFPAGDLRLTARPIGGHGRAAIELLNISAGEVVDFEVQPDLRASIAVVQ